MTDEQGYEFFEHTADVGMRAWGATLGDLFIHAAHGLVALVVEDSAIRPTESRPVALSASSVEELLQAWLTELLVWFDADGFLPGAYDLESVSPTVLRGHVRGERFDPGRHTHGTEVKGITWHQFRVEQVSGRWEARLIFDV